MLSYETTSPTEARSNFFKLLEQVVENHQVFIIHRREGESLVETVYLLRSPANARRLLDAIEESQLGKIPPQTPEQLKRELGIGQETEAS